MKNLDEKGWLRKAFEHQLRLDPSVCNRGADKRYTNPETQRLWEAFKAGIHCRPTRGNFVIAEVDEYGLPNFPAIPLVHNFIDVAKHHQRTTALNKGTVHMIFQQVSEFHPEWERK